MRNPRKWKDSSCEWNKELFRIEAQAKSDNNSNIIEERKESNKYFLKMKSKRVTFDSNSTIEFKELSEINFVGLVLFFW